MQDVDKEGSGKIGFDAFYSVMMLKMVSGAFAFLVPAVGKGAAEASCRIRARAHPAQFPVRPREHTRQQETVVLLAAPLCLAFQGELSLGQHGLSAVMSTSGEQDLGHLEDKGCTRSLVLGCTSGVL